MINKKECNFWWSFILSWVNVKPWFHSGPALMGVNAICTSSFKWMIFKWQYCSCCGSYWKEIYPKECEEYGHVASNCKKEKEQKKKKNTFYTYLKRAGNIISECNVWPPWRKVLSTWKTFYGAYWTVTESDLSFVILTLSDLEINATDSVWIHLWKIIGSWLTLLCPWLVC